MESATKSFFANVITTAVTTSCRSQTKGHIYYFFLLVFSSTDNKQETLEIGRENTVSGPVMI